MLTDAYRYLKSSIDIHQYTMLPLKSLKINFSNKTPFNIELYHKLDFIYANYEGKRHFSFNLFVL